MDIQKWQKDEQRIEIDRTGSEITISTELLVELLAGSDWEEHSRTRTFG